MHRDGSYAFYTQLCLECILYANISLFQFQTSLPSNFFTMEIEFFIAASKLVNHNHPTILKLRNRVYSVDNLIVYSAINYWKAFNEKLVLLKIQKGETRNIIPCVERGCGVD